MEKSNTNALAKILRKYTLEIILVITIIVLSFLSPYFLTVNNLFNILRNISLQGVIAFGMTIVIVAGELDISISSSVALTGVITALVAGNLESAGIMSRSAGVIPGMVLSLIVSIIIGFMNGWLVTRYKIPAMIVTLAMQNILYGIAALISRGFPVITLPNWYSFIGSGRVLKVVPFPVVILLIFFAITFFLLSYTKYGRAVFAVGGNAEAARLSGLNVKKTKIISFIIIQVCCWFSGIMLSSQVMSGTFTFAKGWEMTAISSVVIGGASIAGGIGNMWGTMLGIIFLGVLTNGMTLLNVNDYTQYVVRGALIIFAVLLSATQQQHNNR